MTSHNSNFYGRLREGFNMAGVDSKMDAMPWRKWLWIDDVVQKTEPGRIASPERLGKTLK